MGLGAEERMSVIAVIGADHAGSPLLGGLPGTIAGSPMALDGRRASDNHC